jgi:hypothetical protein
MSPYISSIISKYGDSDKVHKDVKTLNEILDRQGSSLFIDVMANRVGDIAIKYELNQIERDHMLWSYTKELREAILERI